MAPGRLMVTAALDEEVKMHLSLQCRLHERVMIERESFAAQSKVSTSSPSLATAS